MVQTYKPWTISLQLGERGNLDEPSLTETVYSECSCSSLNSRAATRPQIVGFKATSLVATVTPSRVQAGRPGIQVTARPKPAVPGGGMPAHQQRPWALSSSFCRRQRLHRPEDQYSIIDWVTEVSLSLDHESGTVYPGTLRQLDMDFGQFKRLPKRLLKAFLFV